MGPGLFQDEDGLIHIRLSHTTHGRPGVTDYTGERDPRKVPLAIWTAPKPTLLVSDCNSVIIRNLSARFGGGRTIRLEASTDVQLDHLDVRAGPYGVQVGEDCRDTSISNCHVDGGMPPWFFRSDRKDGYDYRVGGVKQLNDLGSKTVKSLLYGSPSCVRTKITQCEFVNGHDLSLFGQGLEFSRNWISNLNDDALIIDGVKVDDLHVFENVIERTLTVLSFAGTAVGGGVYVYRNLFDLRQPTRGIRPRPHDDTAVARFGHLFKTDPPDGPLDLFQNTVIVTRQSIGSSYSLYRDYRGAHPRRSFNNIFVALNPTPESDRPIAYLPNPNHRGDTDGNCYFRSGRTDVARRGRYPAEVRERAVRMVFEHQREYESQWAAIMSIAGKLGMTNETLRKWVRQAEIDGGARPGVSSAEAERVKELERENRELRRANEILKAASVFFARELDPQPPKR